MKRTKRILISLLLLAVIGVAVGLGTRAFFSDTETSTGNVLAAGAIDLKIDNTSYVTDTTGKLVASPNTSWELKDLTIEKFFDFRDLKPGDIGEDTISIHVDNNDAWLCAAARVTVNSDETCTEPENTDENKQCVVETDGTNGDLAQAVNFAFWKDDGDNVLEDGETPFLTGPISGLNGVGKIALADSSPSAVFGGTPLTGNTTAYIGKAWCFGTLTPARVAQGADTGPLERGTGFTCNGSAVNNAAQTDKVVGDLQFYAVQSRNNATFTCAQNYTPVWPSPTQEGPKVGALLSAYSAPATCDVTVDDTGGNPALDAIQEGVNTATAGQTVCVKAGSYTEDVNVNKSITLAGDGPTLVTLTGVGTGEAGALVVTADNVTVKGFKVIGTGVSAMRISGAHSGDTFSFNDAVAATGKNAFLTDGGQSNHTISNNLFEGNGSQLVYVNGQASVVNPSTNVNFTNNTFGGTATGPLLGMEANGSSVTLNKFSGTTSYTSLESFEGGLLVNQNNFDVVGQVDVKNAGVGTLNAENNWWGDLIPADNVNGLVDFTPFEAAAYLEN